METPFPDWISDLLKDTDKKKLKKKEDTDNG